MHSIESNGTYWKLLEAQRVLLQFWKVWLTNGRTKILMYWVALCTTKYIKSEYLDVLQFLKAGQSAILENLSISQEAGRPAGSCDLCRRVSQAVTQAGAAARPKYNPDQSPQDNKQTEANPAGPCWHIRTLLQYWIRSASNQNKSFWNQV